MIDTLFLEFRCPNKPHDSRGVICNRQMDGPALSSLQSHDWSTPYIDTRYCPACRVHWVVTIKSPNDVPIFELIPEGERIDFVSVGDLFDLITVSGRRDK